MQKYGLQFYENECGVLNTDILKEDEITYSVLKNIVNNACRKVFTDGERIVVCLSVPIFPVWIWTAKDATEEELNKIRECLVNEFPLEEGYTYNLSCELWKKLSLAGRIKTNILSYRCDALGEEPKFCGGSMRKAKTADIPVLIPLYKDLEGEGFSDAICEERLKSRIDEDSLFVWLDGEGEIVAMAAGERNDGIYATVTSVYTVSSQRRKGYGKNLVYRITKALIEEGKIPILYADADYEASNGCYRKIGFRQVGSLLNVSR